MIKLCFCCPLRSTQRDRVLTQRQGRSRWPTSSWGTTLTSSLWHGPLGHSSALRLPPFCRPLRSDSGQVTKAGGKVYSPATVLPWLWGRKKQLCGSKCILRSSRWELEEGASEEAAGVGVFFTSGEKWEVSPGEWFLLSRCLAPCPLGFWSRCVGRALGRTGDCSSGLSIASLAAGLAQASCPC